MKEYTIIYKDSTTRDVQVTDKAELIREHFGGSEEEFKKQVSFLKWSELSMQCTLDTTTGKITSEISSADVNPYGWRDSEGG